MSSGFKCRECGTPIFGGDPGGLCAKCLLGLGLEQAEGSSEPTAELSDVSIPKPRIVPLAEKRGDRIGRYKLLEQLGEGGMGSVWMAEQTEPVRRTVALKVIKPGMDSAEVLARFEAERQALALMDHPNIAKILDAGTTPEGRPYFVMDLVKGIPFMRFCDEQRLSVRERLELFMQVCQAIQHAHQKGIIHRDLKPSNVLVALYDGKPVPKVIDFGVAKAMGQRLTERTLYTQFGAVVGTLAYMSPEQAELNQLDIDTRSDIYSLGVLLYELLTASTPLSRESLQKAAFDEVLRRIREEEPPKPSLRLSTSRERLPAISAQRKLEPEKLTKRIRGELDWIVMKALEKDRSRRYETANGLARDIERHMNNEPVLAGPPGSLYRFQKFIRRNKVTVASATTVVVVLVLGLVVSASQWRSSVEAQRGEARQRHIAETNATERREQLVRLDVANGVRAMENGDWFGALLWFTEALGQEEPGSRAEEMHRYRIGALLNYSPRLTQVWFHDDAINRVAFSPDGRWGLTASRDGTARLWDVLPGKPGPVLRHGTNVSDAVFNADGRRVLTVADDGAVRVWDAATGQTVCPPLELGYRVTRAVISPDGRRVFTAGDPTITNLTESIRVQRSEQEHEGEARIWDAATARQVRSPFRQKENISDLALSPDGQWLAIIIGGSVVVWNLRQPHLVQISGGVDGKATLLPALKSEQATGAIETLLPDIPPIRKARPGRESPRITTFAFSPNSQRVATACVDGSSYVWPLRGGKPVVLQRYKARSLAARNSRAPAATFQTATFSPDGQRVMLMDTDGVVRWWDAHTGEAGGQIKERAATRPCFSPDGRFLFSSKNQLWDIEADEAASPTQLQTWLGGYLPSAAFSPDGARLLTAGSSGTVRLWHLAGQFPLQAPFTHDWTAVAGQRPTADEQQPQNMRQQFDQRILISSPEMRHAAFSPDGSQVVTVCWNGSARVWDAASGKAITPFVRLDCLLEFAAFNRDGTRFVTVGGWPPESEKGMARVWDARTGQPLTPVMIYPQRFEFAAFSPDGRWLITQAHEGAQVWDARNGEPAELPVKFDGPLRSLAFSSLGQVVAVCTAGSSRRGNELKTPNAPENPPPQAGGYETRLWELRTGQPVTPLLNETNEVTRMEFSPDGRWLVTFASAAHDDPFYDLKFTARLWATGTGQAVTPPLAGLGPVSKVIFSGDGRRLYIMVFPNDPIILELPSGRMLDSFEWRGFKKYPATVTTDGLRFATGMENELRVFDAATGEPLTPPLRDQDKVHGWDVHFSPDGRLLLATGDERAQLWPLPKENRPVKELVLLAQLLSGRKIDASGNYAAWSSAEADAAWQTLRSKYPASFAIAPDQVRVWRERIVDTSEKAELWFAAAFHLDELVKEHPNEETLRLRRARARDRAALEELPEMRNSQ